MNHLPECVDAMIPDFHNERWICICAPLRACEQRVQEEDQRSLIKYGVQMFMHGKQYGRPMGYAAALDAAREAVLALFPQWRYPDEHAALVAAIDALKEKP